MTTIAQASSGLLRGAALEPGDRVRVVSPSGPVVEEVLREGLGLLRRWDLEVVVDDSVYARSQPHEYLAGEDDHRLHALLDAWGDEETKAIICSRGGYGAMRLLPGLDRELLRSNPKLLVGFSDVTALHLFVAGQAGIATIHGPVVKSLSDKTAAHRRSAQRLRAALFGEDSAPRPLHELRTVRPGTAMGPVFGGNLSLVVALLGTALARHLDGALLVLEDVGEEDYRLDRLLTALRLADGVEPAGVVLGEFTGCAGEYVDEQRLSRFVDQLATRFDCPVAAGAPIGHGARNHAFPVGVMATLNADAGRLAFHRHAAERE